MFVLLILFWPQQVLLLVVLLAGMADRTGANVECHDYKVYGVNVVLVETDGKCPVPEMNAAFSL